MLAAPTAESIRSRRLQQILKKALDVSVCNASVVSMREFFQEACRVQPELMERLFGSPEHGEADAFAEELSAQALHNLRQKIEMAFQRMSEKHDVNGKLVVLEELIGDAEEAQLRAVARNEQANRNGGSMINVPEEPAVDESLSPAELIQAERLRVLQEEKRKLEELVTQMQKRNQSLQKSLDAKRQAAADESQRIQNLVAQIRDTRELAQDFGPISQ